MISTSVIAAVCVTLCVTLFLPLILFVGYGLKNKGKGVWTAWLLGAAGFFVFQIIIRIPLLNLLSLIPDFQSFAAGHYVLYCLLLAFSAGLFEVAGRYLAARLMKKELTFEKGFAAGLGHGGIESVILIGMTYVNNLLYIVMINTGTFDTLLQKTAEMGVDTASLAAVRDTFMTAEPLVFYLAGYERILTMVSHLFLSLLVCYCMRNGKTLLGILICLLLHTALDFVAPLINGMATGRLGISLSVSTAYLLIYGFLTIVAAASIAGILLIRKRWKQHSIE